jgi:hypothetical protein
MLRYGLRPQTVGRVDSILNDLPASNCVVLARAALCVAHPVLALGARRGLGNQTAATAAALLEDGDVAVRHTGVLGRLDRTCEAMRPFVCLMFKRDSPTTFCPMLCIWVCGFRKSNSTMSARGSSRPKTFRPLVISVS